MPLHCPLGQRHASKLRHGQGAVLRSGSALWDVFVAPSRLSSSFLSPSMRVFFLTAAVLVAAVGSAPARIKQVVPRPSGSVVNPSLPPLPPDRGAMAPAAPSRGPQRLPLYDRKANAVKSRPALRPLPSPRVGITQQSNLGQSSGQGKTAGLLSKQDFDPSLFKGGRLTEERKKARGDVAQAKYESKKRILRLRWNERIPEWAKRFELEKMKKIMALPEMEEVIKHGLPPDTNPMTDGKSSTQTRHRRKQSLIGISANSILPEYYRGIPNEVLAYLFKAAREGRSSFPLPETFVTAQTEKDIRERISAKKKLVSTKKERLRLSQSDRLPLPFQKVSEERFEEMLSKMERKAGRSRMKATVLETSTNQEQGTSEPLTNTRAGGRVVAHPLTPLAVHAGPSQVSGRDKIQGEGSMRKASTEKIATREAFGANKGASKRRFRSLASLTASQSQSPGPAKRRKVTVEGKTDGLATPEGQASRAQMPLNPSPVGRERMQQSRVAPTKAPIQRKDDGVLGGSEGKQQRVQEYGPTKSKPRRYMTVMSDSESE